ncbi:hypothetical protein VTJ83DRAFT_4257 [Remersonia thermophila]|uniref:Uncharacterized protein n=1 Tax=Remersonia thermophila TaxID=72144 RepID=A0ABR4D9D9_9PEZI
MKRTSSMLLTAATAAGLAAAQASTTVVSVLVPFADLQAIEGSVISAGPTATSYLLACPTTARDTECGLGPGISVLHGPSILTYAMSYTGFDETSSTEAFFSLGASCTMDDAKNTIGCLATYVSGTETTTFSTKEESYREHIMPVTITAGVEKLQVAATGGSSGDDDGGPAETATPAPTRPRPAARRRRALRAAARATRLCRGSRRTRWCWARPPWLGVRCCCEAKEQPVLDIQSLRTLGLGWDGRAALCWVGLSM